MYVQYYICLFLWALMSGPNTRHYAVATNVAQPGAGRSRGFLAELKLLAGSGYSYTVQEYNGSAINEKFDKLKYTKKIAIDVQYLRFVSY